MKRAACTWQLTTQGPHHSRRCTPLSGGAPARVSPGILPHTVANSAQRPPSFPGTVPCTGRRSSTQGHPLSGT